MEKKIDQNDGSADQDRSTRIVELGTVEELTGTFNNGDDHDDNNQGQMNRKVGT